MNDVVADAALRAMDRKFSAEKRKELAKKGWANPDGSYPIETVGDLKNAIQAFGRANNPAQTKRLICKRARALNALNLVPDGWCGS
jgi:hypothetical protein